MALSHKIISKRRASSTLIYISREKFELYIYRLDRKGIYRRTKYPIAIGKEGDATPSGAYYIDAKTRRPAWLVPPHDDYPPEIWNTIIPFSHPNNPFKGGFLSISGGEGVGIHGVRFDPRLGERASHGCIRVSTPTILSLYSKIPLGTPVIIT